MGLPTWAERGTIVLGLRRRWTQCAIGPALHLCTVGGRSHRTAAQGRRCYAPSVFHPSFAHVRTQRIRSDLMPVCSLYEPGRAAIGSDSHRHLTKPSLVGPTGGVPPAVRHCHSLDSGALWPRQLPLPPPANVPHGQGHPQPGRLWRC